MPEVGRITWTIEADARKFDRAVDDARKRAQELGREFGSSVDSKINQTLARAAEAINGHGSAVMNAFKSLNVRSQAELQATAAAAQASFQTIRNSGTASISDISRAWDAARDIVDRAVGTWTGSLKRFGDSLATGAKSWIIGLSLPLAAAGGAALKMASDFEESEDKTRRVFGSSAGIIESFAQTTSSSLGISEQRALEAAGTFGNLFTAMKVGQPQAAEMSKRLVELASDLASFNNIDPTEALEKLRSGLTGEVEPLRTVGVLLNETAVKAKAAELGYKAVAGQLTDSQKVMARYQLILEQTKVQHGNFEATQLGVANSSRTLSALIQDLGKDFGQVLLPAAQSVALKLKDLLGWFKNLSPATKETIVQVSGIAAVAGPAAFLVGKLAGAVADMAKAFHKAIDLAPGLISRIRNIGTASLAARAGVFALGVALIETIGRYLDLKNIAMGGRSFEDALEGFGGASAADITNFAATRQEIASGRAALDKLIEQVDTKLATGEMPKPPKLGGAAKAVKDAALEMVNAWLSATDKAEQISEQHWKRMNSITASGLIANAAKWREIRSLFDDMMLEIASGSKVAGTAFENFKNHLKTNDEQRAIEEFNSAYVILTQRIVGSHAKITNETVTGNAFMERAWEALGHAGTIALNAIVYGAQQLKTAVDPVARLKAVLDGLKASFEKMPSLQKFNLRFEINDLITGQLEQLASRSGQTFEKVATEFREQLALKMPGAAADARVELEKQIALIDQAILNSTIADLENVWGRPLGRAIEFVLVQFDRLKSETVKKITAIGELLSSLPDALGGRTLNKWISTINQYINFAQKFLTVLSDVFGVGLPQKVKDLLGILTGGAQSTTAIMTQMKDDVTKIIGDMATQISLEIRNMVIDIKRELGQLPSAVQQTGQQASTGMLDGLKNLPSSVNDILRQVGSIFGSTAQKIIQAVGSVLTATQTMGAQVPIIYNLIGSGAIAMGNQVSIGMATAAAATQRAAAQMNAAAQQGMSANQKVAAAISLAGATVAGIAYGSGHTRIGGAAAGAAAGAQIGSMFGPWGTAIGAIGGAIFGGLLGGKSKAQLEQERLQQQMLRDQAAMSTEQLKQMQQASLQSVADTGSKLKSLLDSFASSVKVPQEVIANFIENFSQLLSGLVEASAKIGVEHLEKVKQLSDNTGGMVDVLANLGSVYNAVASQINITREQARSYVAGFMLLIEELAASEVGRKMQRKSAEIAERIKDVPGFVVNMSEALHATANLPDMPDASKFAVLEETTRSILERLSNVFSAVDRWVLKTTGSAATEALPILEFTTSLSATLTQASEQKIPPASAWANLTEGAKQSFDFVFSFFESLAAENLARARALSEMASPITSFVGSLFGMLRAGNDAGTIQPMDFGLVRSQARGLLEVAIDLASEIASEARNAGAQIAEEAKNIPSFVGAISGAIKSASESAGLQVDAEGLRRNGRLLIESVVDLARMFTAADIEMGGKFSEGGSAMASFAKNMGESIRSLKDGGEVSAAIMSAAASSYKNIVDGLNRMRAEVSLEALSSAQAVALDTSRLFEHMSKAASFMKSAAEAKAADFSAMIGNTRAFVSQIVLVADEALRGRDSSATFLSLALETRDNMLEAYAAYMEIPRASAALASASLAPAAGSGAAPPLAPLTIAPAFHSTAGQGAPAGNTYNVEVTVNGTVIEEFKFEDAVRRAVDKANRR